MRRFALELACGLVSAIGVLLVSRLAANGDLTIGRGLFVGAAALAIFGIARYARVRERRLVVLYPDHFVWTDPLGIRRTCRYSEIVSVTRDTQGYGNVVVTNSGTFFVTSKMEAASDLVERLRTRSSGPARLPLGAESWSGPTTFRYDQGTLGIALLALVVVLSQVYLAAHGAALAVFAMPFALGFAIYSFLRYFVERIEVKNDELIWRGWEGRIRKRVPVGAILGAVDAFDRSGTPPAIDTDEGEIRFSANLVGCADLIREAKRLGAILSPRYCAVYAKTASVLTVTHRPVAAGWFVPARSVQGTGRDVVWRRSRKFQPLPSPSKRGNWGSPVHQRPFLRW